MGFLWGLTPSDREQVVHALSSLGPSTPAGLAAALSWTERRTEKAARALERDGTLRRDPGTGRLIVPGWTAMPSLDAKGDPLPVAGGATRRGTPSAPPPSQGTDGGRPPCSGCGGPMQVTPTGDALVCPGCGRIGPLVRHARAPASAPSQGPTLVVGSNGPILGRRSEELFAAYVTRQPIPCPHCRTTLRHLGPGEFGCPSCGEAVRFPDAATRPPPLPTPRPRPG